MAGSYNHCCNKDGSFREEDFSDMIENLGDAHEACEMMHYMINYLASVNQVCHEDTLLIIKEAEEAYYKWLRSQNRYSIGWKI